MKRDRLQSLKVRALLKNYGYSISLALLIAAFIAQPISALANASGAHITGLRKLSKTVSAAPANAAVYFAASTCASPGKDGVGGTLTGIVNTYYVGSGTASGSTVTLGAIRSGGSATAIAIGDLILIIQMQDGSSVSFSNSASYGSGVSSTVGRYEYAAVRNVSGTTLTLSSSLANTYTQNVSNRQTFQVIRVPQYSSATASSITAATWNGTTGGIVAIDVTGTLSLAATAIDVSGKGFRGGAGLQKAGDTDSGVTYARSDYYYASTVAFSGMKGEGTAGTPPTVANDTGLGSTSTGVDSYTGGSIGRGAPGNAGGGSDDYDPDNGNGLNAGGGGGGNGGAGGRGGNSWHNSITANNPPDGFEQGGLGGAAMSNASTQVVMGGGGGAGDGNNSNATNQYLMNGAHGGGIVLVRAGNLSGTGAINANGNSALDLPSTGQTDAGGGGGAGGSVVVTVLNSGSSSLTVNANGGEGGNSGHQQHGPGGGGGGGFIAAPGGTIMNAAGGISGLDKFSAKYNATDGTAGITTTSTTPLGAGSGGDCLPNLTVMKSVASGGPSTAPTTATYTITVQNATGAGMARQVRISDLRLPAGFTFASAGAFTASAGVYRTGTTLGATLADLTTKPAAGNRSLNWGDIDISEGGSVSITFTVNIASGTADGTYHNPAAVSYLDPTRSTSTRVVKPATNATTSTANGGTAFTTNTTYQTGGFASANVIGSNYDGTSTGPSTEDFIISSVPAVTLAKTCPTPADCTSATQAPGTDLTYNIVFTNAGGTPAQRLVLTDALSSDTEFQVGSATTNAGTTGLTFTVEYSSDFNVSSPGSATWTYTPSSGAGGATTGYDRTVKAIRWRVTTGNLSPTAPNNTGNIGFTVRIK